MGKILIVEDDETIRNGLMIMLTIQAVLYRHLPVTVSMHFIKNTAARILAI